MDSTELRLILLGAGIIFIIGIYAWEQHKRRTRGSRVRVEKKAAKPKRRLGRKKSGATEVAAEDSPADFNQRQEPVLNEGGGEMDGGASDATSSEPRSTEARQPLPEVIVVNIAARTGSQFQGDAIMSAARDIGLEPGPMDIFHRTDENSDKTRLSMASMVKPGVFPFENMSEFTSPGLALFVQLPGPRPALVLYDEMLEAAERLAALLDGRIMDENRKPLTRVERERMRERLADA